MAYTNGTATDYKNLLAILATFATANGWTILEQSETQIYLKGEGASALDEIFVGINAFENTSSGYYNWNLEGAASYRSGRAFGGQVGTSGAGVYAYLWNAAISYWMVATARRIILVAKVSTVYQVTHLGLIDPPATDAQYPYPLFIGGCGVTSTNRWSTTGTGNTCFCANIGQSGDVRRPSGLWSPVVPGTTRDYVNALSLNYDYRASIISAPDGSYLLDQIFLAEGSLGYILGAVDGLYRVSGYNNAAENILTINGVNYFVFPDVYRSSYSDYFAMRMN